MVATLMMSLDPLKIKIFWNKFQDVITSAHDVPKILWLESNCIVDLVMWPKFGYSSTSMREVIITPKL